MNQQVPTMMDVTDLQFILQHKLNLFSNQNPPLDSCNLLASASTRGVVFVGGYETHLLVCPLSALTDKNITEEKLPHFKLQLPSRPHQIALSCDDAYLAVDVEINRNFFILIYSVESIINQSPKVLEQVKLSAEDNVRSKQILWNPVQNNIFAVLLDNGGMSAYVLQEKGFQFYMLDKAEQTQCACWSPKGKQIVVGFRNGKIVQYKPDLKSARNIQCPPGTFANSFQTIAIQWLSTYQFATIFLSDESPDATPCLHIVNAPKAGSPAIRSYGDICYSSPGPRKAQVFLIHLAQWNLLLVSSANSMEVGILGTNETGDFPSWSQWITSDEARAELPLTEDKDDTYPIGFCIETGCTHNVFKGETRLPLMPMIHLLSTHGIFVSFNVINLKSSYVDICSPPRPLPDGLRWEVGVRKMKPVENLNTSEISFASPSSQPSFQTSTPANEKSFFSLGEPPKTIQSNLFGGTIAPKPNVLSELNKPTMPPTNSQPSMFSVSNPVVQPQFSTPTNLLGGQPKSLMNLAAPTQPKMNQPVPSMVSANQSAPLKPVQKANKPADPIITVQPTFNKTIPVAGTKTSQSTILTPASTAAGLDSKSDDGTISALITEEIQNFERDLKDLLNRTKNGKELESNEKFFTTEYKNMVGFLGKLQDTMAQATEATETLKTDIHSVRLSLNEAFAMQAEAQSKYNIYNDPDYILLHENAGKNQTNQKQLSKLKSMLKANEVQFNEIYKIVYSQYSNFEETRKQQSRDRMKMPSLQLVYQSLNKQQDLIQHQRKSLNLIKQKIGLNSSLISSVASKSTEESTTVESLTDSIISLSIADRVKAETSQFTDNKKKNLLEYLKNREVQIIKPSRPENEFLISKIINGRKIMKENTLKIEKEAKAKETLKVEPKPQTMVPQKSRAGMVPFGPGVPHVYKPSPVTASQDTHTQPPKFTGFSTPVAPVPELPSNANAERKKKEIQKTPTTTLQTVPSLAFPGSISGFNFNSTNTLAAAIKKNEPDSIPTQFSKHNQKPSPNFGFGSTTPLLFGNTNASKEMPKLQDIKIKPNIPNTPPPQIFAPKPIEVPKSSTGTFTLKDVSNADTKTITSMPSGVDFSLGSGLSITKLGEKPATTPQAPSNINFKQGTAQDKSAAEINAPENPSVEVKPSDSLLKSTPISVPQTQAAKIPASVPTSLSTFQSIGVSSALPSISTQAMPVIATSAPFTASTALPVTVTTTAVTTAVAGAATVTTLAAGTTTVTTLAAGSTTVTTLAAGSTTVTTPPMSFSFGTAAGSTFSFANAFAAKAETPATSEPSTDNLFQGINICKPTATTTISTSKTENIFASALHSFGNSTITSSPTSIFGGQTTITNTSTATGFGTAPPNTSATSAVPVTPANSTAVSIAANPPFEVINLSAPKTETSIFSGFGITTSSAELTPTTNVFTSSINTSPFGTGGSIFGGSSETASTQVTQAPSTNLFGSALAFGALSPTTASPASSPFSIKSAETIASPSPFSGVTPNNSIFGGAPGNTTAPATAFGFAPVVSNSSTIFGGGASGDSVFGIAASTAQSTSSVFGTPINSSATSGGSLFGSGFGAPAPNSGSIFGGGNSGSAEGQSSPFSFVQKTESGSVFASPSAIAPPFGQNTPNFGSPSGGAFSATQQTAPAFGSPSSFGGGGSPFGNSSATFGGPATFGTTPTFGGTATFMSPTKSAFGAFGAGAVASQPQSPAFGGGGAPQQQNTLFEQLGSSDNGLSFGNLAQTANSNQNKPAFGGSAFMSWR